MQQELSPTQKALQINLEDSIYGSFAEIGAGQEVANHFFKAGAASGTVAKSISAYDMVFSDSIYGKEKTGRYVCQARLETMLDYEYGLVVSRLDKTRKDSKFFAFANTVSARNFHGSNEQHGWLGLKFRLEPNQDPSQIVLHIRMHDNTNLRQQNAIGILGVNLIYASYFSNQCSVELFIDSLMEGLSRDQVEIDMIHCEGPAFDCIDDRLLNLQLVKKEITDAVIFNKKGEVTLSSDELYKKNIQIIRGSYRPPTKVNMDILDVGLKTFSKDIKETDIVSLAEITISQLQDDGDISNEDFLARVDILASLGQMVMISSFRQYYRLTDFLKRFKAKEVSLVLGTYNFMQIFDSDYNLAAGKTLEAIGMLLAENMHIYLYPYKDDEEAKEVVMLDNVQVSKRNQPLLEFIKQSGQVKDLDGVDTDLLHIYSRKVLVLIEANDESWENLVPRKIAKIIKDKKLFGFL